MQASLVSSPNLHEFSVELEPKSPHHSYSSFLPGCAAAGRLKLLPQGSSDTEMDGGDGGSPVMTDSERRAYRYGHRASPSRLPGMRKSWSNDSLAAGYGRASCVCAPTTHPGSFRCKHHRHHASNLGAAAAQVADDDAADAKHSEQQGQETAPATDQADKSS